MTSSTTHPYPTEYLLIQAEEEQQQIAFASLTKKGETPLPDVRQKHVDAINEIDLQLIPIFDPHGNTRLRLRKYNREESRVVSLFTHRRPNISDDEVGLPATLSQNEFSTRFSKLTHNLLEGGAVLACLLENEEYEYNHTDVDIFIVTMDEEEANQVFSHIYSVINSNVQHLAEERYRQVELVRTSRTMSIKTAWKVFQIVTTLHRSRLEVLINFDVDCGCVGTMDGQTAVTTQRGMLSLEKRYNVWIMENRRYLTIEGRYQKRLAKYGRRGFAVLVPNFDWKTLPQLDGVSLGQLQGMANLALLDRLDTVRMDYDNKQQSHVFASGIEECIHGGDAWCSCCHKKLPHAESDPKDRLSLNAAIHWERHDLSFQDFDHGLHIRQIGDQAVNPDFEAHAYVSNPMKSTEKSIENATDNDQTSTSKSNLLSTDNTISPATTAKQSSPPSFSFSLSSQDGIEVPQCYCGLYCALKAVKKTGPNHARRFFCCKNSRTSESCDFFKWADATLPYKESRAERLRNRVDAEDVSAALETLRLDKSKQLLAVAACFKSGRLTATERTLLKEIILSSSDNDNTEKRSPLDLLVEYFDGFTSHQNLDYLGAQLSSFCVAQSVHK